MKGVMYIALRVFLSFITVLLIYYTILPIVGQKGGTMNCSGNKSSEESTQAIIKKQIAETAATVRNELTYLSLEEKDINEPVLKDDFAKNKKLKAQFVLTLNAEYVKDIFFFQTEEYTLETGGDLKNIYKICDELDALINGKNKIIDAIKKINIKLSWEKGVKIEFNSLQVLVVECLYVIRKFVNLESTEVEILVKGYADGQRNAWQRKLEKGYEFNEISVYPPLNQFSKNPFEYIRDETYVYKVLNFPIYGNSDLPNLRAQFFMNDFIEPFIKDNCGLNKEIKRYILDGYEFKNDREKEEERKVQVLILLY